MPRMIRSAYERLLIGAKEGPIVRPELGPCLDYRKIPRDRYPTVKGGQATIRGNRLVLEQKLGRSIREGYCALHHCDRTICLRPEHIYEGTMKDNVADRDVRTGNPFKIHTFPAEKAPNAKFNEVAVKIVRFLAARGVQQSRIARAYGVCQEHIRAIVVRKIWASV